MHVLNIGVPRTATVYIQGALSNVRQPHHHWHLTDSDWSHVAFVQVPPEYEGDFKLGVVRNPFDLLVDLWSLMRRMDVLMHHYDRDLATLEFRDWLTLVAHRRGKYPLRYPLHFQLFKPDWSLGVDYLARVETLDEDLAKVAEITGGTYTRSAPVNTSPGRNPRWQDYYDSSMVAMVEDAWYADLAYFGYTLDGYNNAAAMTSFGLNPKPRRELAAPHPEVPWVEPSERAQGDTAPESDR